MAILGRMLTSPLMPGLVGTVVNVNVSAGMWGRVAPTCDVLWNDMQCTRRVSQASLQDGDGGHWVLLDRWQDANTCARLWHEYQIHRVHQMAERAAARQHEQPHAPNPARGLAHAHPVGHASGAPSAMPAVAPAVQRACGREVAGVARELLAKRVPGARFAVTCSRQHLDVSWIDGPVEGYAWRVLAELKDKGLVTDLRMRRTLSAGLIQRAIDFCLERVFEGRLHDAPARYARLRVTPEQYCSGALSGMLCEGSDAAGGLAYQTLLRCVLARWDDARQRFVDTAQTRGLVQEMGLLFANGDDVASHRFLELSSEVSEREDTARRLVERVTH